MGWRAGVEDNVPAGGLGSPDVGVAAQGQKGAEHGGRELFGGARRPPWRGRDPCGGMRQTPPSPLLPPWGPGPVLVGGVRGVEPGGGGEEQGVGHQAPRQREGEELVRRVLPGDAAAGGVWPLGPLRGSGGRRLAPHQEVRLTVPQGAGRGGGPQGLQGRR